MAVAYSHIELGVRLISTIVHPADPVSLSAVLSFASNMPTI